jgi:hypothetical protein
MTSMVEKVARAICAKEEPDGLGNWKFYTDHARAAIEAMMEPTDHMLLLLVNTATIASIYRSMITSALKEET